MRFLFLSYAFPGPLAPIATWLGKDPDNQVIFATCRSRQDHSLPNVRRVIMKKYQTRHDCDYLGMWAEAVSAGKSASATLKTVCDSGFEPQIIFNASSNGMALGIRDIFPNSFYVNFLEEENFVKKGQMRMRCNMQILQILDADLNFSLCPQLLEYYSTRLEQPILAAPVLVDADFYSPASAKPFICASFRPDSRPLVAIFCANAESPCIQMCLELLKIHRNCHVALILANSHALCKLENLDLNIPDLHMEANPPRERLRDLLASSLLAVLPRGNYGLLEAMSCGAAVMAPDAPAESASAVLPLQGATPRARAECVAAALGDAGSLLRLGKTARKKALQHFDAGTVMPHFFPQIMDAWRLWQKGRA